MSDLAHDDEFPWGLGQVRQVGDPWSAPGPAVIRCLVPGSLIRVER